MANGLEEKIKEIALRVSRYFSDFLESDFKKGKVPSRRIRVKLTLINHLFTNRSAIDFVLEKLAEEMQRPWVSPD